MATTMGSPCAACKFLRRKCTAECVFAPYFPPEDPHKFANVHKVFGASNVSKLLNELPLQARDDAVNSLAYEADARIKDPVYGCVGAISILQHRVAQLEADLVVAQSELCRLKGLNKDHYISSSFPLLIPYQTPNPHQSSPSILPQLLQVYSSNSSTPSFSVNPPLSATLSFSNPTHANNSTSSTFATPPSPSTFANPAHSFPPSISNPITSSSSASFISNTTATRASIPSFSKFTHSSTAPSFSNLVHSSSAPPSSSNSAASNLALPDRTGAAVHHSDARNMVYHTGAHHYGHVPTLKVPLPHHPTSKHHDYSIPSSNATSTYTTKTTSSTFNMGQFKHEPHS